MKCLKLWNFKSFNKNSIIQYLGTCLEFLFMGGGINVRTWTHFNVDRPQWNLHETFIEAVNAKISAGHFHLYTACIADHTADIKEAFVVQLRGNRELRGDRVSSTLRAQSRRQVRSGRRSSSRAHSINGRRARMQLGVTRKTSTERIPR